MGIIEGKENVIIQPQVNNLFEVNEDIDVVYYTKDYWNELLRR